MGEFALGHHRGIRAVLEQVLDLVVAVAARDWLAPRAIWWGYAPDAASYGGLLHQADIVVSTALQEFFGIAVLEAMYCGCVPVLPHRLAYPELLPETLRERCLYAAPAGLADHLQATIGGLDSFDPYELRAVAARFDWSHAGPAFDTAFEYVAAQRHAAPTSHP